jgi:TonB family protein
VDSVRVSVRAELVRTDGGVLPNGMRELVAQELMLRLTLPRPLAVPTFAPGPTRLRMLRPERGTAGDTSARLREPEIHGVYHFRLLRTGRADSLKVVIPSLAPGLDSSVLDALRRASDERTLPMFPEELREDTLRMQLRVTSASMEPRLRAASFVLFQAMFPRHLVTDVVPWEQNPAAPYPEEERANGRDGDVLLRAVIDMDGVPVIPTLEVSHATSRAFALSALRTIARWRFTPARVGGCPVLQIVRVPFWFSVRP